MVYRAFGLSLATNCPVAGLTPQVNHSRAVDTRIWLNDDAALPALARLPGELWYVGDRNDAGMPALRVWKLADGSYFRLLYADGTEFVVDRSGSEVWATWLPSSTLEDTATYLLGPVLGFVLRLRGITCLHASAVAVGDRAVALVGPAQAGKSTLAAAFARMGHRILSDDIAALAERNGKTYVQPAYPQLRLWPDAVSLLYGSADALPQLTPTWEKRALDLTKNGYRFQEEPLPLSAIYVLGERGAESQPRVVGLLGRETLVTLVANSYVGYLSNPTMREQEFETLARLASRVPVRRVIARDDPADLSQLCLSILSDCEASGCTASPTMAQ